jgi:flagella basal body P-ring formation protein FlgA
MRSSVRRAGWALLLALPWEATAQAALPVPPALAAEVTAQVAARWGVAPERVALDWGAVPADLDFAPGTPVRLTGHPLNGWFAVVLRPTDPDAKALRVRAGVIDSMPVAAHALAPGTTLAPADLRIESRIHWGAPGPETGRAGPGWEVRRALTGGEILTAPQVMPPTLIAAGQPITLRWRRGQVEVRVSGTALHAARAGQTARVTLVGRRGRITGRVVGPATISLSGDDL